MDARPAAVVLPVDVDVFWGWAAGLGIVACLSIAALLLGDWGMGGIMLFGMAAVIGGLFGAMMAVQALRARGGELRMSAEGFHDTRYLFEPVPWSQIDAARVSNNHLLLVFAADSPNRFRGALDHWYTTSIRMYGQPALQISAQVVEPHAEDLLEMVEAFRHAERESGGAPLPDPPAALPSRA